jgi:serine protease Do
MNGMKKIGGKSDETPQTIQEISRQNGNKSSKALYFLFFCFAAAAFFLGSINGKEQVRFPSYEESVIKAVKEVKPAVVGIKTYGGYYSHYPLEIGSGVIFRSDGYILTNAHVLLGANKIMVTLANEKTYTAALVAPAQQYDLAVLKIPATHLPYARFGNSSDLELGQTAIAIGNPLNFGWTVTVGVVSALNRNVLAGHKPYRHLIQTDAAINPGNSGGPLINTLGNVIGINTLVWEGRGSMKAQGLGFAIPANTAMKVADELLHEGYLPQFKSRVRLGVSAYDLTPGLAMEENLRIVKGVVVETVEPGSPAQKGGILPGDVITKINGHRILGVNELIARIRREKPDTVIVVELWRNGIKRTLRVKLVPAVQ